MIDWAISNSADTLASSGLVGAGSIFDILRKPTLQEIDAAIPVRTCSIRAQLLKASDYRIPDTNVYIVRNHRSIVRLLGFASDRLSDPIKSKRATPNGGGGHEDTHGYHVTRPTG